MLFGSVDNYSVKDENVRIRTNVTIDDNLKEGRQKATMAGVRDSPKLDMEHGFIQTIIKNQVDRDEYDKEQKAVSLQKKNSGQSRPKKRAPLQVYVPPHLRAKAVVDVKTVKQESESSSKGKKHIFCCIKEFMLILICTTVELSG